MSRYQLNALFLAHAGPVVGVHESVQVGAARASNRSRLPHDGATDRNGVNLKQGEGTEGLFAADAFEEMEPCHLLLSTRANTFSRLDDVQVSIRSVCFEGFTTSRYLASGYIFNILGSVSLGRDARMLTRDVRGKILFKPKGHSYTL